MRAKDIAKVAGYDPHAGSRPSESGHQGTLEQILPVEETPEKMARGPIPQSTPSTEEKIQERESIQRVQQEVKEDENRKKLLIK